jgi:hypothetical protein
MGKFRELSPGFAAHSSFSGHAQQRGSTGGLNRLTGTIDFTSATPSCTGTLTVPLIPRVPVLFYLIPQRTSLCRLLAVVCETDRNVRYPRRRTHPTLFLNSYRPPLPKAASELHAHTPPDEYDFNFVFDVKTLSSDRVELRPFVLCPPPPFFSLGRQAVDRPASVPLGSIWPPESAATQKMHHLTQTALNCVVALSSRAAPLRRAGHVPRGRKVAAPEHAEDLA